MNEYIFAVEKNDINRIRKLNALTDLKTFWNDCRKLCKNTHSDHAIGRWQCLCELRYDELSNNERWQEIKNIYGLI